ncbi:hypothetical protein BDN72DRAFT_830130 [Pluteus cervinus]|uniref:Uncharacterized protein n=1 Tax=Pluteus cervinus TaxID=181527 RepID=A0ACD3BGK9_9AGAR|nr:hypothetical protein BDN72DRAFT_830130 [Pluteus cervinus]
MTQDKGELQIKDIGTVQYSKITMALRSIEVAYLRKVELGESEVLLFSQPETGYLPLPSSCPFSIPLTSDTPQSIQTPHSCIKHTLTATIHPMDPDQELVSKSLVVHTKRYSSHLHSIPVAPRTFTSGDPTRIEVQVPREHFRAGEPIPLYITIPPPSRELVAQQGLRLRNVRAELVRSVKVHGDDEDEEDAELEVDDQTQDLHLLSAAESSTAGEDLPQPSKSKAPPSPVVFAASYQGVIARSGASCRFHSSRPVQLRFVLHQPSPSGSPYEHPLSLSDPGFGYSETDADCASITQLTLLHSVTFRVNIHVSFVNVANRTERISVITIPVTILPPAAPLPEAEPSLDTAYQKKHDRPPVKTNREDDSDGTIPHYVGGEAGPSMVSAGAPPPFEEREAPPPFSTSASTSNHLPTFLEAENEIILPEHSLHDTDYQPLPSPPIFGEGLVFGFLSSQQFDGHSEDPGPFATPPPTVEMATRDPDLTSLADIEEPHAIEVLGLVLEQHDDSGGQEQPPPPPPALDDPSDPPPSIDSEFRSPEGPRRSPTPSLHMPYHLVELPPPPPTPGDAVVQPPVVDGHAPPPYLIPHVDVEHAPRPPPYVD